jgi:hypothetical protein
MALRILSEVHRESVRIALYLENRQPGDGSRFFDCFDAVLKKIEENALGYPRLESITTDRNIRRVLFETFPYLVIYEILADETVVEAVRHVSQEPGVGIPGAGVQPRP